MVFLPKIIMLRKKNVEQLLKAFLQKNFKIYGWRQVPINPSVLGEKAEITRPEIAQVLFKHNDKSKIGQRFRKESCMKLEE